MLLGEELLIPKEIDESSIEELLSIIRKESNEIVEEARKCKYIVRDDEIDRLLDEENLKRYKAINSSLKFSLKDFDYELYRIFGTVDETEELGRLMQCWITLGSCVETSLQIFLSIYLNDYQNSNWGKWEEYNYEKVKNSIGDIILELRNSGNIGIKNSKTLKKDIKDYLSNKKEVTSLEKTNLNTLISFFENQPGWRTCEIAALHKIRINRNVIHSFKWRQVDSWDDLVYSLKFYALLLINLQDMMPPFDEIIDSMLQDY